MRLYAQMIGETVRALAVLALVFLSFGHQPVAAVSPTPDTLSLATATSSWCGGPVSDDDRGHAPCHACRIAGALLPPPEGGMLDAEIGTPVIETYDPICAAVIAIPGLPEARGPPRLA